jgi:hypothetical protein
MRKPKLPESLADFDQPMDYLIRIPPPAPTGNSYTLGEFNSIEELMEEFVHRAADRSLDGLPWRPLTNLELYVLRNGPALTRFRYDALVRLDASRLDVMTLGSGFNTSMMTRDHAFMVVDIGDLRDSAGGVPEWVISESESLVLRTVRTIYNIPHP